MLAHFVRVGHVTDHFRFEGLLYSRIYESFFRVWSLVSIYIGYYFSFDSEQSYHLLHLKP